MKERAILFNGEMVRAILAGTKTQTRRVVKPQPDAEGMQTFADTSIYPCAVRDLDDIPCPYGQPGDRLWVRETWNVNLTGDHVRGGPGTVPIYRAQHPEACERWRPSIHMPRWASRIALEVTGVRVERLQAISEEDAQAEGFEMSPYFNGDYCEIGAAEHFRWLWDSINAKRGFGWATNPWVFVVSFRRVEP